jgi:uncharacterized protein Usg
MYIDQRMKVYTLTIYIIHIHVECANIIVSHYIWQIVEYDFMFATNRFFIVNVHGNLFIVANYNHK